MPAPSPSLPHDSAPLSPPTGSRREIRLAALLIVLVGLAAYANSLPGVFVFDDLPAIVDNPSIRRLDTSWQPPAGHGITTEGRPLLNFSFALNRAVGGLDPVGYHVVNLGLHLLAALTLFGLVRRTLARPGLPERIRADAPQLAAATAGLWVAHPLQTESVTYVVQRAESLAGLAYLFTGYAFLRHATAAAAGARTGWGLAAALAAVAGLLTKEVVATAPLVLLVYDRLFLSPDWRTVGRRHGGVHALLALTLLIPLAGLLTRAGRGDTAGFGTSLSVADYVRTQIPGVVHYLRLCFWPHPLVFDYGRTVVARWSEVLAPGLVLAALGLGTVAGLARGWRSAFLGLWFFGVLAPSSSVVPIATQTLAEHRLYLPLGAVLLGAVLAVHAALGRRSLALFALAAVAAVVATHRRNTTYADAETLWRDTARAAPGNARARVNLGVLAFAAGRLAEARAHFTAAVALDASDSDARTNLAAVLRAEGRGEAALPHAAAAVRLDPASPIARLNYAGLLRQAQRFPEAEVQYARIVADDPDALEARLALGLLQARAGRWGDAEATLREAHRRAPAAAEAANQLGYFLLLRNRAAEAVAPLAAAARLGPRDSAVQANYGVALARSGRRAEAIAQLQHALTLDPANALARAMLRELKP